MAVPLGAELDVDDRTRGRSGRPEHLLAAHHDLDRPPRFFRQHVGDRLEIDDRLAAEAAADLGRDRADVGDVGADDAGGVAAHHELALARAPDRGLAVGCDRNDTGMRLDIALVHRLCRVAPLDDDVGLAEPGLDVALGKAHHLGDVGGLGRLGVDPRGKDFVVQHRRVGRHRRLDVHHVRQHLVLDLDQVERLLGDRRRNRGDRGHRVTLVKSLADRHAVARQVPQIGRRRADNALIRREVREVGAGRHRLDARQRHRLVGVDRHDPRMGVRAALDLAPQHAGHDHVGAEIGAAGDLVDAVRANGTGADDLEGFFVEETHRAASPLISAAASSTARMILS